MLTILICNNIFTLCVDTQMKLINSLNNEENTEIIDKTKKKIDSINIIIQSITNYIMLIS
jgi:hypothetical protein